MKIYPIALSLFLFAGCGEKKADTTAVLPEQPAVTANVSEKEIDPVDSPDQDGISGATNVARNTSFNGILVTPPQQYATITLTMGGTIHELKMIPGQFVRRGTVLATLKNPEFITLQQQYLEAAAQTEYLENEYQRQERLSRGEAASQKRFQQSKSEYLSMKSRLDASAAQLTILGIDPVMLRSKGIIPFLEIKAPVEGYVADMNVNRGSYINPGDKICDIINKSDYLLCLTAYEKDLGELEPGKQILFHVNGMGDEPFTAELLSVGQKIDEESRSLEVYARVHAKNSRFRPGMYVTARIEKN